MTLIVVPPDAVREAGAMSSDYRMASSEMEAAMRGGEVDAELPEVILPVERSRALVRGLWRLLCAVLLALPCTVARLDWGLLWLTDKATFVGLGLLLFCPAAAGLALAAASVRWFAMALWRGSLGVRITPHTIEFDLGPFGRRRCRWADVRVELEDHVDPEMIDMLPDDAFIPRLVHVESCEDLAQTILRFAKVRQEELTKVLRPYLAARL